ncbi:MAG: hypothetical protein V1859_08600 [archaeon]
MDLLEWAKIYLKNKDTHAKKIISMNCSFDKIECECIDGPIVYFMSETLDASLLEKVMSGKRGIFCLNIKKNIDFIIKNWNELIKNKELIVVFANPATNNKWVLRPYTHNLISDESTLSLGLKSLFEGVEEVIA